MVRKTRRLVGGDRGAGKANSTGGRPTAAPISGNAVETYALLGRVDEFGMDELFGIPQLDRACFIGLRPNWRPERYVDEDE